MTKSSRTLRAPVVRKMARVLTRVALIREIDFELDHI